MEESTGIHVINLATYQAPSLEEVRDADYVLWGDGHTYFDWIIDRYHNSATNNAVINNMSRLIYGRGLSALDASRKPNEYAAMMALFSPKLLRKTTRELKMLGQTAFQVIYNKQHTKIAKVEYIPVKQLAAEKCNDEGKIEGYYYSDNWEDVKNFPPVRVPAFGTSKEEIEILYIQPFQVGLKYYSTVDYEGCLPYCVLEEEISDFLITTVQCSFSGTKVVNFNNGTKSPEEERIIANKVKNQLTGATGDRAIIAFNNNVENKTTIDDIPLDDAPEHYAYISKEAQEKILNCHNVISPMIVGVVTENNGFSSNADEIEIAAKYFYNIAIQPFQDLITDAIDEVLAFNGINLDLYFKRLNLLDSIEEENQKEEELTKQVKFNSHLEGYLQGIGETVDEKEWILIDEREVDLDKEDDLDGQVKSWEQEIRDSLKKTSLLSKIFKFAGTGTARPNAKSAQDGEADGFYFKTRYEYVGEVKEDTRPFCKAMVNAGKLYRKEDLVRMNSEIVNPGHGHDRQDYNVFLYKGGVNCHHKFKRKTFVSASAGIDVNSPRASTVSTNKAQKFGYRVDNPSEVSMKPVDMPNNGHHPNYKA